MTYRHDILDELQALKREAGRRLQAGADELREASSETAKTIGADMRAFVTDLRDALSLDEAEIERIFAGRAAAALTTALVLGVVIGATLRKRP
jgi:hypothetical protein